MSDSSDDTSTTCSTHTTNLAVARQQDAPGPHTTVLTPNSSITARFSSKHIFIEAACSLQGDCCRCQLTTHCRPHSTHNPGGL
jgi:hypothetical protein